MPFRQSPSPHREFAEALYWLWWSCDQIRGFYPLKPENEPAYALLKRLMGAMLRYEPEDATARSLREACTSPEATRFRTWFENRMEDALIVYFRADENPSSHFSDTRMMPMTWEFRAAIQDFGRREGSDDSSIEAVMSHSSTCSWAVRLSSGRVLHIANDYSDGAAIDPKAIPEARIVQGALRVQGVEEHMTAASLRRRHDCVDLPGVHLWPGWNISKAGGPGSGLVSHLGGLLRR